jgi:uncharacterized membrane protein
MDSHLRPAKAGVRRGLQATLLVVVTMLMVPTVALAQLEVCNAYRQNVTVAIAVHARSATTFAGAGWFALRPGQTRVLVPARLETDTTDYLVSVVSLANGQESAGSASICTSVSPFSYPSYVWEQSTTCRAGFVSRKYEPISGAGFWLRVPMGTDLDVRQCQWTLSNPATHRLEGNVYFDGGGPAPDQMVILARTQPPGPSASTRTGADGTFSFANLQIAGYTVRVDAPGYLSEPVPVVLQGGQDSKGITIKLVKR